MSRMQQPTLTNVRIRSTRDAHQIFYAVARGLLPITIRRLDSEERRSIVPGNVYVWEERGAGAEATGLGIERWTDGMRWSPSRVRDDFLFYHQKDIEPDESVLDARWPRPVRPRATSNASGPSTAKEDRDSDQDDGIDPEIDELNNSPDEDAKPRTMEKDTKIKPKPGANPITRPGAKKDPERLVKQTYSVHVYLPSDPQSRRDVRKWHLTAYYTQATFQSLQTVEQRLLDALKSASVACAEVPEGWFKCARTGKVRRDQTKRGYTVGMPGIQYPYGSHLPAPPSQTLPYPPAPMSAVPISPSYHHGPPGPPPGHPSHISPPPHHGYAQAAPPLPHGHAYPPFPYPPSGSSGPPPPPPPGSQSNMYYAPYYSGPEIEREHPHGPNLDYDYPYSAYSQGHGPPSPYSHPPPPHPGYPHNYPHDLPPQHHSYPPPPPPGQVSYALNERQYGYPPGGVPPTPQMTSAPPSSALPPPSPPSPPHSNHSASSSTPHIAAMSSPPIPTLRSTYPQQTLAPMAPNAGLERSPRSPYRAHPYLPPIIGEKEARDDGGNRRWRSYSYSNPHSRSMSPRDKQGELERNGKDTLATGHTAPFGRERAYTDLDVYSASSRSASTSASVSASASTRESSPDPMMSPARRKVEGMSLKAPIGPIKMPLPPPPSALPPSMQTKAQLHNESMDTEEVISGEGRAVLVTVSDVRSQPAEKGKQTGDAMDVDKSTPRAVSSGPTPESRDRDSSATATPPSGLRLQSQTHSPLSPSTTSPTPSSANPKTPRSPSGMMSSALSRGMSLVPLDYLRNAQAPRRDPRDDMLLRQLTALTTC